MTMIQNKDIIKGSLISRDSRQDVQTLISILREVVGRDMEMIAALVNEEAELLNGKTDLPVVKQLAHELIDIAQKGLAALEDLKEEFTSKKGNNWSMITFIRLWLAIKSSAKRERHADKLKNTRK